VTKQQSTKDDGRRNAFLQNALNRKITEEDVLQAIKLAKQLAKVSILPEFRGLFSDEHAYQESVKIVPFYSRTVPSSIAVSDLLHPDFSRENLNSAIKVFQCRPEEQTISGITGMVRSGGPRISKQELVDLDQPLEKLLSIRPRTTEQSAANQATEKLILSEFYYSGELLRSLDNLKRDLYDHYNIIILIMEPGGLLYRKNEPKTKLKFIKIRAKILEKLVHSDRLVGTSELQDLQTEPWKEPQNYCVHSAIEGMNERARETLRLSEDLIDKDGGLFAINYNKYRIIPRD
jgi:hypothetical protein